MEGEKRELCGLTARFVTSRGIAGLRHSAGIRHPSHGDGGRRNIVSTDGANGDVHKRMKEQEQNRERVPKAYTRAFVTTQHRQIGASDEQNEAGRRRTEFHHKLF